ncbi:adenosylmethionine--8-amino-7-oxononanoate transaminase [Crocinitomicaceae bacterium]|nr:adenosylmethionine--8-amino-7-oxononanoate transaminase [Crocinitomicaceae bacterium]MDC0257547.1 adenosylmethionine--8-amino-7-oxononanoate transaminase [Crocinitomicaceae bacterium]
MSQLISKDQKHVWHPFTQHHTAGDPLPIVKAEGVYLYDETGKSYIDANASWWVNTHGHGHPHIGKAMSEQFQTVDHIVFAGATHPKAVELAERICGHLPDHFQKVFFSDNGSTAVEIALKMAIQYWHNKGEHKQRFLAMHGSYHGDTFGAMSVGQRGYFNAPFEPLFFDTDYLDFPTESNEVAILERAEILLSSGDFAGLILEPLVQGAAGMRMYSAEFLDRLTAVAQKHDVLVIFDEVMTGFGKTGKLFSMDHCQNKPDFVALSKGLTAGVMALGLTVTSNKIYEAFLGEETTKALLHGHSFTANPIACAVACANLDLFEHEETWQNIDAMVDWNQTFAQELSQFDFVANIRQQGTILAFEVQDTSTGSASVGEASYFSDLKTRAYEFFLERGVLLRPLGNVIFVNPPFCITEEEYGRVKEVILEFLKSL